MSVLVDQDARWRDARSRLGMKPVVKRMRRPPPPPVVPRPKLFTAPIEEVFPCIDLLTLPSWKTIPLLVAQKHGLTFDDLIGPSRKVPLVTARMEAIALLRSHTEMSLPKIAQRFNRDHTTILHLVKKWAATHDGFHPVFPANNTQAVLYGVDFLTALEHSAQTGAAG